MERMASKQGHAYHAYLGGGFKYLLFSSLVGETIHFD